MREKGRPFVSTVLTVHQTMRRTRSSKVFAMSWNVLASGMADSSANSSRLGREPMDSP
jgi:hypothetical protein